MPVTLAAAGSTLQAGTVFLADSEDHMTVQCGADGACRVGYTANPRESPHRPSIDVLFASLAACQGTPRMGILLTGMGRDGAEGLLALRQAGGHTVAQDQGTSIVYGMPRAASELAAASASLPLYGMASAVLEWVAGLATGVDGQP